MFIIIIIKSLVSNSKWQSLKIDFFEINVANETRIMCGGANQSLSLPSKRQEKRRLREKESHLASKISTRYGSRRYSTLRNTEDILFVIIFLFISLKLK
jgi:hypothetical protein